MERVRAPKFTSVPSSIFVAAITWSFLRPSMTSGAHFAISSRLSDQLMSLNNGHDFMASYRVFRKRILSSPQTRLMCGTCLMNCDGSGKHFFCTRYAQTSLDISYASEILIAFDTSTLPSDFSGV